MDFQRIFQSLHREYNQDKRVQIKNRSIISKTQDFSQFKKDVKAQERPF